MNIVQTCWSCNQSDLLKFSAGWLSAEYNIMSWTLSALQLNKFYSKLTLYADSTSARMLKDTLQLPYSEVFADMDSMEEYHPGLWALPKVITYARQDSPFLHVDGDVFIWKPFSERLLGGSLIAQNEEGATLYYENMLRSLESELKYFPPELIQHRKSGEPIHAFNAGILGGHDIKFFKGFTEKAIEFVNRNKDRLSAINASNFNIFFEQYLFFCLVWVRKKKVEVLIDEVIGDNQYRGFADFIDVPYSKSYLHLLGDYKRNRSVCDQMASKLRMDYPEYYYRIIELFKSKRVVLAKDYYFFNRGLNRSEMMNLHFHLLSDLNCIQEMEQEAEVKIPAQNIRFRIPKLEAFLQQNPIGITEEFRKTLVDDLAEFESKLFGIVMEKFSAISRPSLYGRDLLTASVGEILFGLENVEAKIVASSFCLIVETRFDWSQWVYDLRFANVPVYNNHSLESESFLTLVVAECDQWGYSLANIDSLDQLIISLLEKAMTVSELMDSLRPYFDKDDLESSGKEFRQLIFGRIKKGILNKSFLMKEPLSLFNLN